MENKYSCIKDGAKFTPKKRDIEYSVFIIINSKPDLDNNIEVSVIDYLWANGHYIRVNRIPYRVYMDRDELLRYHAPSHQGRKLVE